MAGLPPRNVRFTTDKYWNSEVTLVWDAPESTTGNLGYYTVQTSYSDNNGSTWSAYTDQNTTLASVRTLTFAPSMMFGRLVRARVSAYASVGGTTDYGYSSNNVLCDMSPATAPTSCSVSATLAEGNVILSWSGAGSSNAGPISGYQIQYSESTNNSSWGTWTDLSFVSSQSTSGTLSVAPPTTRGNYRRFRVRTEPSGGETYASTWITSSNSVRRNTLPTAPSTFTASPSTYQSGAVSLAWSGVVVGTSAIKNYVLQVSTSTNNSTWGSWTALTTVTSTATSGSYSYTPSSMTVYTRYRICVTDTLSCISAYVTSVTIIRNSPPPTPTIVAPKAGMTIYNDCPRVLITLGVEPDGDRQMLCVRTSTGVSHNSVNDPDNFSRNGWMGDNVNVKYRNDPIASGARMVYVKAADEVLGDESGEVSRSFIIRASPFEEIIPNETPVKASHITTLRTAVNNVRAYYGLAAVTWQEEMVPGKTQVMNWTYHIIELRKAVDQIISFINNFDTATVFDVPVPAWISIEPGRPRAAIVNQLQELILLL